MVVDNTPREYNLSRNAASKLLKVSIRTVDRYVKDRKVSSRLVNGRIWLNKEEIEVFVASKYVPVSIDNNYVSTSKMSIDNSVDIDMDSVDNVDNIEVFEQDSVQSVSTKKRSRGSEEETYQKLFNELREELKEKQARLEIANYRVGQLESQVKNSIPMLEYHRENFDRKKATDELQKKMESTDAVVKKMSVKVGHLRLGKRIYLTLLLIVLALQPLWLILLLNPSE